MDIQTIKPAQLTDDHLSHWRRILDNNPSLDSPFLRPEFVQAVGRVRRDSEVAILRDGDELVGFFPFERLSPAHGKPICGRLSDFQAVIVPSNVRVDPVELISACQLSVWDFDHMIVSQNEFAPFRQMIDGSPYIDLSDGYDAYESRRFELGGQELKQTKRKARKISREVGPLRLVHYDPASESDNALGMFEATLLWKAAQYRRSRITNVFAYPWTNQLLSELLQSRDRHCRAHLTGLFAGSHLVATHLGVESNGVLHYWFPAYDTSFAEYSPGRILLQEICRNTASLGIRRVDLGRGVSSFKARSMTGVVQVAVGSVDLRPWTRTLRQTYWTTRDWVKRSPLRYPARMPARMLYQLKEWMEFH